MSVCDRALCTVGVDRDGFEPGLAQQGPVSFDIQGARHAGGPRLEILFAGEGSEGNGIGHGEPASRAQDPECFAQHRALVFRQVDDAVGDDNIDRSVGKRNVFDGAFQKRGVLNARACAVGLGDRKHLVGHVDSERASRCPDRTRRDQDFDARTAAEVEHRLARLELREFDRTATAETERTVEIELGGPGWQDSAAAVGVAAAGILGGLGVVLANGFSNFTHDLTLRNPSKFVNGL